MTTFTDQVYINGGMPVGGLFTAGKSLFLKPSTGSDGDRGTKATKPIKTLTKALSLATANKGDTVYFISEGNASSACTDYQVATDPLDWNKDGVNLVGINSGNMISPRSRVAWASTTSATADKVLFTVSANNCRIENMQFFNGIDDANLSFCTLVSGDRNYFRNCHFAGIGHATNDAAGAYSLKLTGGENVFENCVIGIDTIARGTAANSEILLSGGAERNVFKNCIILTYAEAATHQFLTKESAGIDRFCLFENCVFMNAIQSGATTMTEALDVTAGGSPNGLIMLKDCALLGADDWEGATVTGEVYSFATTSTAATTGLAVAVAAS